jgi:K+-sensing histidine kinase KdpD
MLGTVAANITADITLQAQANTSAQKRTRLLDQSRRTYSQALAAPTKIKSITSISIETFHNHVCCKNILFYFLQTNVLRPVGRKYQLPTPTPE